LCKELFVHTAAQRVERCPRYHAQMTHDDISTRLIHHRYLPPGGFEAPMPAVHKASTVFFPDIAAMKARDWKHKTGYTYGLHGTPTTFTLEERLAELEGGLQCLLAPSGLCAIALVNLALLRAGDEVLIPTNAYGPGVALAQGELAGYGITHRFYDPMRPETLDDAITAQTKLVWLEAPGSVTMEFPDLSALAAICRTHRVTSALDNTWGAGLAFDPFALDDNGSSVDLTIHALTKYPSGGGDVLMGSVVTRDGALHMRLKMTHMRLGIGVGANDAEAILRSLPSIALRYAAQDRSARSLAEWLATCGEVAAVLHPALEMAPGHAHWRALCGKRDLGAGIFSVVLDERFTESQVHGFCDSLRLFRIGYSWGGPVSLVVPYNIPSMRNTAIAPWTYRGPLVRLAIGLEAPEDLRVDLMRALATLAASD
jgi:cystathionine beta-lyase